MAVRRLWSLKKGDIVAIRHGLWKNETGTVIEICASFGVLTLNINGKGCVTRVPVRACSWPSLKRV